MSLLILRRLQILSHECGIVLFILLVSFVSESCFSQRVPTECKSFYGLPSNEQDHSFPTYSLEKQLIIYRCGLDRRPPDSALALYISGRGEAAIPILLEKLETEQDERFQSGIIDIFRVMSVKGYLRNRPDVLSRIRQVPYRMKIPIFREMCEETIKEIEKNNSISPTQAVRN